MIMKNFSKGCALFDLDIHWDWRFSGNVFLLHLFGLENLRRFSKVELSRDFLSLYVHKLFVTLRFCTMVYSVNTKIDIKR